MTALFAFYKGSTAGGRNWLKGGRRNWKRRYFFLSNDTLTYYDDEEVRILKEREREIELDRSSRTVAAEREETGVELRAVPSVLLLSFHRSLRRL